VVGLSLSCHTHTHPPTDTHTKDPADKMAVSNRKLSMRELGIQMKHYNGTVRKDALHGMQEIVHKSPGAVVKSGLAQLFAVTFAAVNDADKQVRLALYSLFEQVFPLVSEVQMQPFMKLLLAHVCSGLHPPPPTFIPTLPLTLTLPPPSPPPYPHPYPKPLS
jgi:pre-rRNA-processing protein IPI1